MVAIIRISLEIQGRVQGVFYRASARDKAIELGLIDPSDPTLVLNTGSGLKDVQAASKAVKSAPIISPTIEALKEVL